MFDLNVLLAAAGGGIFGAALGGVPAFVFTGLMVLVGIAAGFSGATEAAAVLNEVAFGPFFGPHVAFCGGVAAAAYAAKKGIHESGKDVATGLIKLNDPGVLLVGAVFGIFGYILNSLWVSISLPTDTIALTVVISNAIARLIWGNGLFGKVPEGGSLFQVTETNVWVPWQKDFPMILLLGIFLGALSGYACIATGSPVTAFGLAAFTLFFNMTLGVSPVWHHIAAPAGLAALNSGSILMGAVFGVVGALLGELGARLLFNYGDTHIDPPAFAIFITTAIVLLLV